MTTLNKKLPKRFKDKWVKMLRSGKYRQSKSYLCLKYDNEYTYCCLGVACLAAGYKLNEFYDKEVITSKLNKVPNLIIGSAIKEDANFNPLVQKLVNFNDDKDWSFKKIASYIERYL